MTQMNYYDILEIKSDASQEVIKAAYRALAKKYHPDTFKGSEKDRMKSMVQINAAFEILSDENKRAEYDRHLKNTQNSTYDKTTDFRNSNAHQPYESQEKKAEKQEPEETERADECYEEDTEEINSPLGSKIGRFFKAVGKEIISDMQENSRKIENAYLEGLAMDEYMLVRRFKQSKGYVRVGYSKAMEEKGLLRKSADGKYEPTYQLKRYL